MSGSTAGSATPSAPGQEDLAEDLAFHKHQLSRANTLADLRLREIEQLRKDKADMGAAQAALQVANEQLVADEKRLQGLLSEAEKRIGILECDAIAAEKVLAERDALAKELDEYKQREKGTLRDLEMDNLKGQIRLYQMRIRTQEDDDAKLKEHTAGLEAMLVRLKDEYLALQDSKWVVEEEKNMLMSEIKRQGLMSMSDLDDLAKRSASTTLQSCKLSGTTTTTRDGTSSKASPLSKTGLSSPGSAIIENLVEDDGAANANAPSGIRHEVTQEQAGVGGSNSRERRGSDAVDGALQKEARVIQCTEVKATALATALMFSDDQAGQRDSAVVVSAALPDEGDQQRWKVMSESSAGRESMGSAGDYQHQYMQGGVPRSRSRSPLPDYDDNGLASSGAATPREDVGEATPREWRDNVAGSSKTSRESSVGSWKGGSVGSRGVHVGNTLVSPEELVCGATSAPPQPLAPLSEGGRAAAAATNGGGGALSARVDGGSKPYFEAALPAINGSQRQIQQHVGNGRGGRHSPVEHFGIRGGNAAAAAAAATSAPPQLRPHPHPLQDAQQVQNQQQQQQQQHIKLPSPRVPQIEPIVPGMSPPVNSARLQAPPRAGAQGAGQAASGHVQLSNSIDMPGNNSNSNRSSGNSSNNSGMQGTSSTAAIVQQPARSQGEYFHAIHGTSVAETRPLGSSRPPAVPALSLGALVGIPKATPSTAKPPSASEAAGGVAQLSIGALTVLGDQRPGVAAGGFGDGSSRGLSRADVGRCPPTMTMPSNTTAAQGGAGHMRGVPTASLNSLISPRFATLLRAPAAPDNGSDGQAALLSARMPASMDAAELSQDKASFEARKRIFLTPRGATITAEAGLMLPVEGPAIDPQPQGSGLWSKARPLEIGAYQAKEGGNVRMVC